LNSGKKQKAKAKKQAKAKLRRRYVERTKIDDGRQGWMADCIGDNGGSGCGEHG
jgi:hypothetical protein